MRDDAFYRFYSFTVSIMQPQAHNNIFKICIIIVKYKLKLLLGYIQGGPKK